MTSWSGPRTLAQRIKDLEAQLNSKNVNANVQQGWYCRHQDCVYGIHGIANYMSRTVCNGCYRPRATTEAMKSLPSSSLQHHVHMSSIMESIVVIIAKIWYRRGGPAQ